MASDGKYGRISVERGRFHEGEPVFLLRAQDPLAADAVDQYALLCEFEGCHPQHLENVRLQADRIRAWQSENPPLVKAKPGPDVTEEN